MVSVDSYFPPSSADRFSEHKLDVLLLKYPLSIKSYQLGQSSAAVTEDPNHQELCPHGKEPEGGSQVLLGWLHEAARDPGSF